MRSLAIFLAIAFLFACESQAGDDISLYQNLYAAISDIVSPGAKPNPAGSLLLMELPGLAVGREDLDPAFWAARGFQGRIPDAVFAGFVDRAPRFLTSNFDDSGAKISKLWKLLMTSYKVPPNDDPNQLAAVDNALNRIFNSTLEEDLMTALDAYDTAKSTAYSIRDACLTANKENPSICADKQVVPELKTAVAWFNMETRRRSLLGAQATVLALQSYDLKSIFAEALQTFERSKRIDVGAEGYGSEYYNTFAQPASWWKWFPASSYAYDMISQADSSCAPLYCALMEFSQCKANGVPCFPVPTTSMNITSQPLNGRATVVLGSPNYIKYTANAGFVGPDSFTIQPDPLGAPGQTLIITVGSVSSLDPSSLAAFATVTATADENSLSTRTDYAAVSSSYGFGVSWGMFRYNSGSQSGASSFQTQMTTSNTEKKMQFSLARVNIIRPWLDPLLLQMYPVGMAGVEIGTWSDGSGLPASQRSGANARTVFNLPVIPTSFIVAKDIVVSLSSDTNQQNAVSAAASGSYGASCSYGPFFSGSATVSTSFSSSRTEVKSVKASNSLTINGPQVIGWVCAPVPLFPNTRWTDPVFQYRPRTQ